MPDLVFSVCTKAFYPGLGALLNSLLKQNFEGTIVIYSNNEEPEWFSAACAACEESNVDIYFRRMEWEGIINYAKPFLLKELAEEFPDNRLFYFDSDIVIVAPWSFFSHWARQGVAVCQDTAFDAMGSNHPLRGYWKQYLRDVGIEPRPICGYANSGFLAIDREHLDLIDIWSILAEKIMALRGGGHVHPIRQAWGPLLTIDQDLLNIALMGADVPVSWAGKEGMSFGPSVGYMVHALGPRKPWHGGFVASAIRSGRRPSSAAKVYWQNVRHPIPVFGQERVALAKAELWLATALARLTG